MNIILATSRSVETDAYVGESLEFRAHMGVGKDV